MCPPAWRGCTRKTVHGRLRRARKWCRVPPTTPGAAAIARAEGPRTGLPARGEGRPGQGAAAANTMSETAYLTRKEAAALCGCHVDSIRRAEKKGLLPHTRQHRNGSTQIAVADLVAAGMLDPLAARTDVTEVAGRSRAERDLTAVRQELAVAYTQIAGLTDRMTRQDDEIAFLRALLKKAAA